MKSRIWATSILLLLVAALFYLINLMTVRPGVISGNGNIAILLMMPLPVFFIALIFLWSGLLKRMKLRRRILGGCIPLILFVVSTAILFQYKSFKAYTLYLYQVNKDLPGVNGDWAYINSITSGLSAHVNNQYFNLNTFFIFILLTLVGGIVMHLLKDREGARSW